MLRYAVLFLIVAVVAGLLGYFGIAGLSAGVGQILFMVFLVLFLASLITGNRPANDLKPVAQASRYKARDRMET